jgi:hypothetical protein
MGRVGLRGGIEASGALTGGLTARRSPLVKSRR